MALTALLLSTRSTPAGSATSTLAPNPVVLVKDVSVNTTLPFDLRRCHTSVDAAVDRSSAPRTTTGRRAMGLGVGSIAGSPDSEPSNVMVVPWSKRQSIAAVL